MVAEFMDRQQRKALGRDSCCHPYCRGIGSSTIDNARRAAIARTYIDANHMVVAHKRPKSGPPIRFGSSRSPLAGMAPPLLQSALRRVIHRCLSQMGGQAA
jgi:hypothetical protein